jgi:hypothetical protein
MVTLLRTMTAGFGGHSRTLGHANRHYVQVDPDASTLQSVLVVEVGDVRDADDRAFRRLQPGDCLTPRFLAR